MHEQIADHERNLSRLNGRLRTLYQCNRTLFQAESEQDLLQSICDILAASGEFRLVWIGYCETDAEKLVRPVAKAGSGLDYLELVKVSWGDTEAGRGPIGIAIRTGKPCWLDDIRTDPRFSFWQGAALARGYASCVALPLSTHESAHGAIDLRGTLNLYSAESNFFDENTLEYCTELAMSVTCAVIALRRNLAEDLTHGVTALRASEERRRARNALQATQMELARAMRFTAMGQMAASIAHEINQPLTAVVANASAGLRFLTRETPDLDEARAGLKLIVSDALRASDVITSIRAMFKTDREKRTLLKVNELIREVLTIANRELPFQQLPIQMELIEELPHLLANRVQLQQVILNLITNAIEAMTPTSNRTQMLQVRSKLHSSDGVLIEVEDSGMGIDPKDFDRIFDAFYTTKTNGMGMGLAICRSIVEAHGGRLWASAAIPHGSIFHVILPGADMVDGR
jgi:signal transduction histidine kinase